MKRKVRIISESNIDLLNKKLEEFEGLIIDSVNVNCSMLQDHNLSDGSICNEWIEYIATIIYTED